MPLPTLPSLTTVGAELSASLAAAITSRLDFAALLHDQGRMLQVSTALPALALIPEGLQGEERVNAPGLAGFEFHLDALSTNAHFELKRLIGEQITLRWLLPSGPQRVNYRSTHGYVSAAHQLGGDGGLARYRLTLVPFTHYLGHSRDNRVYQDQDARQIIEALLAAHPQSQLRWDAQTPLLPRSLCTQYAETNAAFIERLLREEGLAWHFEHLQGDAAKSADDQAQARHVLVITDAAAGGANASRPDLGDIRFTAQHVTATQRDRNPDSITGFQAQRRLQTNATTRAAWDYKRLHGLSAQAHSALPQGEVPTLEHYSAQGAYRYANGQIAQARADQALSSQELGLKTYQGQGGLRAIAAGCQFSLIDHPHYGSNTSSLSDPGAALRTTTASHQRPDNRFTVLHVRHRARNNLGSPLAQLLQSPELEAGTYTNDFLAVPAAAALTPQFQPKPQAPGAQVALVVGLPDHPIKHGPHTDRDNRIKVQLPWQRGQSPNSGGLPQPAFNERDDCSLKSEVQHRRTGMVLRARLHRLEPRHISPAHRQLRRQPLEANEQPAGFIPPGA